MTGADMLRGVRELLHDVVGQGFATTDTYYTDEQILRGLNEAKERVGKMLIASPRPALIAANRLAVVGLPNPLPDDFWKLMGGVRADGTWVPPAPATIAKPLSDVGHDFEYVLGGELHGPATTIAYWRSASELIKKTPIALTEFSDSAYFVVQLLAARDLLPQERADAVDRWKLLTQFVTEEMQSFV